MRVAIAQVDGKWPNLALAKIAAHHRALGDEIGWFNSLFPADITYASKVFLDTADDPYLPEDAITGGSGYSLSHSLPEEIERLKPDWSLWPMWQKDIGFSTRGCVRRCPFCIVPQKEGGIRVAACLDDLSTGRDQLVLLDSNITAAPIEHFRQICEEATARKITLDFSQGFDARLLTEIHAEILRKTRLEKWLHFAFDHPRDEPAVRRAIDLLFDAGFPRHSRIMFYVLVGYDTTPEEDMYRVELLRDLGVDPFVMRFDRSDPYQTRFSRWVNRQIWFRTYSWEQFNERFKTPYA